MKEKKQRIRDLLGLTQQQLAILLRVSHSQLALSELGSRKLSSSATETLAELLELVKTVDTSEFMKLRAAEDAVQHKNFFEKLLKENHFQQERISRLIVPLEQKYRSNLTALYLMHKLSIDWKVKAPNLIDYLVAMKSIISRSLNKKGYYKIAQHKIKLQLLQEEEKIILTKIASLSVE